MDDSFPDDAFVIGGPVSRLTAAVRVVGDTLDPADVTRALGVEPRFAARKGDTVQRGSRTVVQRVGIWTHRLSEDPSPEWELSDAIDALLVRLPSDLEVWRELGSRYKLDVFCGLFLGSENQGVELRPETLRALAERGLTLGLDVYGPF